MRRKKLKATSAIDRSDGLNRAAIYARATEAAPRYRASIIFLLPIYGCAVHQSSMSQTLQQFVAPFALWMQIASSELKFSFGMASRALEAGFTPPACENLLRYKPPITTIHWLRRSSCRTKSTGDEEDAPIQKARAPLQREDPPMHLLGLVTTSQQSYGTALPDEGACGSTSTIAATGSPRVPRELPAGSPSSVVFVSVRERRPEIGVRGDDAPRTLIAR